MSVNKIGKHALKKMILDDAAHKGILRMAMIEITDYCNYNCGYCYVRNLYKKLINSEKYKKCIDELAALGCMYVIITGGEPLTHPKFKEIYTYTYGKIRNVSVFTNASLIDDKIVELFKKYPPYEIEVTLYGAEKETYEAFVNQEDMFAKFQSGLDLLEKAEIEYSLKSVINKKTVNSLDELSAYAQMRGVDFRFDTVVAPRIDGSDSIYTDYRLDVKDAVDFLLKRKGFVKEAKKELAKTEVVDNSRYLCDAGKNSVFIDANLNMSYCVLVRNPS